MRITELLIEPNRPNEGEMGRFQQYNARAPQALRWQDEPKWPNDQRNEVLEFDQPCNDRSEDPCAFR